MSTKISIFLLCLYYFFILGCKAESNEVEGSTSQIPESVDFNYDIKPILSDRCYKCHGPDENVREGNLRLDTEEGAFALLDSLNQEYAIVPGNLKKSFLVERISSKDPEFMMPPPESKLNLSQYEIQVIKKWIEQGAEWKSHWAFTLPKIKDWEEANSIPNSQNLIDYFIGKKLKQKGLKPSAEDSKEKLIRRLSFDLRGLPPSLEEINSFLADDSDDAYENLVDQFLSQESYGERMTLEWLDLARYADSHGYQDDLERSMWPWRDWVIKAFNKNMGYDQFVTWQLAGDLLPNATYEHKLATGFNRNHKITQEVGVVDEEYRVEYVLDRVNTFSTSFLGLTVGCAQCHDHKFDPISQKEFYSLFSFFNNVPEKGRVEYGIEVAEPTIPLPDSLAQKHMGYIQNLTASQIEKIEKYVKQKARKETTVNNREIINYERINRLPKGLSLYYPFDYIDNDKVQDEVNSSRTAKVINGVVPVRGKFSGGLDFSGENHLILEDVEEINFHKPITISFWFYSIENGARGTILTSKTNKEGERPAFELSVSDDKLQVVLNQNTNSKKVKRRLIAQSDEIIPGNKWVHFALTFDGRNKAKGLRLYMSGEKLEMRVLSDNLTSAPKLNSSFVLGRKSYKSSFRPNPQGLFRAHLDELMVFERDLPKTEIEFLYRYDPVRELLTKSEKTQHEEKRVFYHELHHSDPEYQLMTKWLSEFKSREMRMENVVLNPTMVMQEMDTVRPAYVLERGSYSAPTERVYPGTPKHILPFIEDYPKNRLGLAQWLFDKENPLTARVTVNRYWQMIFGRGIVTTPEDFGSQGDLPSHPELLDWLALEFVSSNWNLKKLIKTMVMSTTYRQSTKVNQKLLNRDPENILLARGPQSRLQAELVRDHALSISGLLSHKVGGPSVKPYQPKGLWLQVASGNQALKEYIQDHGDDLYRKSMYTFWKRSLPPPSMVTFDASTREHCAVERQSTSTPMQALVLLNDPQFTEASRLIAQKMLSESNMLEKERITMAFRMATSRYPTDDEIGLLVKLLQDQKIVFESDHEKARNLLEVGEYQLNSKLKMSDLAAYTVVANAIMNLSETIRKA